MKVIELGRGEMMDTWSDVMALSMERIRRISKRFGVDEKPNILIHCMWKKPMMC